MLSAAPLGTLSNMNRVQQPAPAHISGSTMLACPLRQASLATRKRKYPSRIFVGIVVIQFQGTGRIHFASNQLLDLAQPKLLEGRRRISHIAVVGQGMQQAHHQPIGDASLIQIAFVEFQLIGGVRKHVNFTVHRRILGHFASAVSRGVQGLVQRRRQGQLTEVKRSSPDPGGSDVRVMPHRSKRSQDC